MNINFEKGAGKHVVECFGKTLDEDGFIIDPDGEDRVQHRGDDVHIDDLAMIEHGSTLFVDDSFGSLVEHVERNRE